MSSRTTELRLLTLAGCVAALLPRLAHRGMFLDGLTYASIARNLADGRGHFWEPFYTATIYPSFHEHPPLAFWLQSLWFRLLGDHWFVERAYCATAAMLIAWLIAVTWRSVYARADGRDLGEPGEPLENAWLPIAFWMLAPVVSWAIVGNLLETTVCVFVTAAVAAIVIGRRASIGRAVACGCLSGLCVAGAALSKGPVGLFPLSAPVILTILPDRRSRTLWSAAGQWLTVAVCAMALYAVPSARDSLSIYIDQQVVTALAGQREVSGSSLTIVVELVQGVWLPMSLAIAVIVAAARGWIPPSRRDRQIAVVFTLIGLAGTLPLLVSPKQTGHYLMPAVPFYAVAFAALSTQTSAVLSRRLSPSRTATTMRTLAAALALGAVAAIWAPAIERDPVRLAALDQLAPVAPRGDTIGICPSSNGDWVLHAWMQRRFRISLDAAEPRHHEWFLKSAADVPNCLPPGCAPASDPARELVLMRCR